MNEALPAPALVTAKSPNTLSPAATQLPDVSRKADGTMPPLATVCRGAGAGRCGIRCIGDGEIPAARRRREVMSSRLFSCLGSFFRVSDTQ